MRSKCEYKKGSEVADMEYTKQSGPTRIGTREEFSR